MASLEELRDLVAAVDVWQIIKQSLNELSDQIIAMNKKQLLEGKMSDGSGTPSHTGSPKSRAYVAEKIARGVYDSSISPHYNYLDEGSFFKNFVTKMTSDAMEIKSLDEKGGDLITEFGGASVYGLTDENLDFLIKIMLPTVNQRIREKLKLN